MDTLILDIVASFLRASFNFCYTLVSMFFKLQKDLEKLKDLEKAKFLMRFFKTGKGQYGEGDIFWGITVPQQRKVAKNFKDLSVKNLQKLLNSKVHEFRLIALLILVEKYETSSIAQKARIVDFYLKNTKKVNNWDLVDLSAAKILGDWLFDKDKKIIYTLAKSENIWEKRIAMIATYNFIKNHRFEDSLKIAAILLFDKHDLIQKAVGWMLREIGKRDLACEEQFLDRHYKKMPRTTLRYAIERFSEEKRKFYLSK